MFSRVIYEDSTALFTIVAFGFAAAIFVTISWRALRMKPRQVEHYENLPFHTATPACVRPEAEGLPAGQDVQSASESAPQHRS